MSTSDKKTAIWRSVNVSGETLREKVESSVHNTGNILFQQAVMRQLDYDLVVDDIPEDQDEIGTLVLTLANFIRPVNDLSYTIEKLKSSKIEKIILIGVGAQSYDYDMNLHIDPTALELLRIASERSKSIGVRGYYSAELLNRNGIKNVDVIGCPSLFQGATAPQIVMPESFDPSATAIHTTPSGYFRDTNAALFDFAIRNKSDYILQNEHHLYYLFDQNDPKGEYTKEKFDFFCGYYANGTTTNAAALSEWLKEHAKIFFEYDAWKAYMKTRHLVVGNRFHGNVVGIHAGIPTLTLWFDTRTRELAEYFNLPNMGFEEFSADRPAQAYLDLADPSAFQASYGRKYARYMDFLKKNELSHKLPPSHESGADFQSSWVIDGMLKEIPSSQRVAVRSLFEHAANIKGAPLTEVEARGIVTRLRASRSADDGAYATDIVPRAVPRVKAKLL